MRTPRRAGLSRDDFAALDHFVQLLRDEERALDALAVLRMVLDEDELRALGRYLYGRG